MDPLLTDADFVEQLLRNYLEDKHQEMFQASKGVTAPFGSPCTLRAVGEWKPGEHEPVGRGILWLELARAQGHVFIILSELISEEKQDPQDILPAGLSRIVSIDISDPNGHTIMKEIVEDKLCELSTAYQNQTSSNYS